MIFPGVELRLTDPVVPWVFLSLFLCTLNSHLEIQGPEKYMYKHSDVWQAVPKERVVRSEVRAK